MSGCTGTSDLEWREEVRLSDGRIVIVEREAALAGGVSRNLVPDQFLGKIDEYRIRFASPTEGKAIEWRSTKRDYLTYPETPLVFELDSSGQPVIFTIVGPVVATAPPCATYSKYVYQNGTWVEESLPEQFRPMATNLVFVHKKEIPRLLTLIEKKKRNPADEYAPAFRQVGPTPKACGKAYIR